MRSHLSKEEKEEDVRKSMVDIYESNKSLRQSEMELENECTDYIPLENYDSDIEIEELEQWDLNDEDCPNRIVAAAYSIGGIRRYNYVFKLRRREVLGEELVFTDQYMQICKKFLFCIQ